MRSETHRCAGLDIHIGGMSLPTLRDSLLTLVRAAPKLEHWVVRSQAAATGRKAKRSAARRLQGDRETVVTDTGPRDAALDAFLLSLGFPDAKKLSDTALSKAKSRGRKLRQTPSKL
jgi:hypothetical protein